MANGVGYCANSRYRPYICAGNSAQTCCLCGRAKGGFNGCWARGCLRNNGGAPETLSAKQLRNRMSNIRPRHRERAQEQQAQLDALLNQERQALEAAAEARGLKPCLRATTGRKEGASARRARLECDPPSGRPLKRVKLPADVREPLLWDKPGEQADCDNCGCSCDPNAPGALQRLPGRSRFACEEVLCPVCAKDARASRAARGANKHALRASQTKTIKELNFKINREAGLCLANLVEIKKALRAPGLPVAEWARDRGSSGPERQEPRREKLAKQVGNGKGISNRAVLYSRKRCLLVFCILSRNLPFTCDPGSRQKPWTFPFSCILYRYVAFLAFWRSISSETRTVAPALALVRSTSVMLSAQ